MREADRRADAVRRFNRFYTQRIGALGDAHLGSPFSLTEVRVLYELAHRDRCTASNIVDALGIDPGHLSRTLRVFKKRGLVETEQSTDDRRHTFLRLSASGRRAFAPLEKRTRECVAALLAPLSDREQRAVLDAMQTIRVALGDADATDAGRDAYVLRDHRPGDMGWIVYRHGVIYADEYGYDEHFEALVAHVVAEFIDHLDPKRERAWIAERASTGEIVGSVFVVEKSKSIAQLRLLLVEPSARGMGLGTRLVAEVVRFARQAGYQRIQLWTQRELKAARRIYKAAGFRIVREEEHASFGRPAIAEVWQLTL
jgi:DNA-binding MarR family transcriptional regulator/ribosomal protein S18 acetylase RimI-like enzyme